MTDKIPIVAAETIGKNYRYDQVVIYARRVGDIEWVTTWGKDRIHCDVAARIGETIGKGVVRPLEEKDAEIARLKALIRADAECEEAEDMAAVGRSLMDRIESFAYEGGPLDGWAPAEDPAEIVTDLLNMLDEARTEIAFTTDLAGIIAMRDVLAERKRQIAAGYDAAHDDTHAAGDLICAEWGARARMAGAVEWIDTRGHQGWKRARELLVDATALLIAEIERGDRAFAKEA